MSSEKKYKVLSSNNMDELAMAWGIDREEIRKRIEENLQRPAMKRIAYLFERQKNGTLTPEETAELKKRMERHDPIILSDGSEVLSDFPYEDGRPRKEIIAMYEERLKDPNVWEVRWTNPKYRKQMGLEEEEPGK